MMFNGWNDGFFVGIRTIDEILTAGIAITAFSLLFYALTFNLRDRVARSFAIILLCVVIVFSSEALQTTDLPPQGVELLLRLQWLGIVFLPASYLHLSDAILSTAGRPSRGRRRWAIRATYALSTGFLVLHARGALVGAFVSDGMPVPYLQRTVWTTIFTLYYVAAMVWAGVNFWRAYRRMLTRAGRRRMIYLMAGATAPAMGSYPYLLYGSAPAAKHPLLFWLTATSVNFLVGGLVVVMAYAVAFFGVSSPDRLVKSRLFRWILRGPVTASVTLGTMTIVRRAGEALSGGAYSAFVPITVVGMILLMEHTITLAAPFLERWLFFGGDRSELLLLQRVEERLFTRGDLRQFLEAALAAMRDHLQSPSAFLAALDEEEISLLVFSGERESLEGALLSKAIQAAQGENGIRPKSFSWGAYRILPLRGEDAETGKEILLGILGVILPETAVFDDAAWALVSRASLALEDRLVQKKLFRSLQDLQPKMDALQRWRAVGRYDSKTGMLSDSFPPEADLAHWVKDALSHYWGGPKLTDNPLIDLEIVRQTAPQHDGNAVNALRAILRKAVDRTKPEGERRFTTEWVLYNILEMKFIEGRKVREVASRLAMSEADLYRKQRVAIEAVAKTVMEMEANAKRNGEKEKK